MAGAATQGISVHERCIDIIQASGGFGPLWAGPNCTFDMSERGQREMREYADGVLKMTQAEWDKIPDGSRGTPGFFPDFDKSCLHPIPRRGTCLVPVEIVKG